MIAGHEHAVNWISTQCKRLLLKDSIAFSPTFPDSAVVAATELLAPGVVSGQGAPSTREEKPGDIFL